NSSIFPFLNQEIILAAILYGRGLKPTIESNRIYEEAVRLTDQFKYNCLYQHYHKAVQVARIWMGKSTNYAKWLPIISFFCFDVYISTTYGEREKGKKSR